VLVAKGKLRLVGIGMGALRGPGLGTTDGYPSPELLSGSATDERSDIYSLGGLIFHGLSGKHPAAHPDNDNGAPSLRAVMPEAPEGLDAIVSRCLAKDPGDRFQHIDDLAAAAQSLRV
jgi:serine/threonine-protein kinase